jgi:hypothetical protein
MLDVALIQSQCHHSHTCSCNPPLPKLLACLPLSSLCIVCRYISCGDEVEKGMLEASNLQEIIRVLCLLRFEDQNPRATTLEPFFLQSLEI